MRDDRNAGDPPPQPTLYAEGGVVLRPWQSGDTQAARLLREAPASDRFGVRDVAANDDAIRLRHEQYADDRSVVGFLVEQDGAVTGAVEVRQLGDQRGELSWITFPAYRGRGIASAAVRRLIDYAFQDLGLLRVEARAEPDNRGALRVASRAGLRREGWMRAHGATDDGRQDFILLARLADDPDVRERDGFIGILNSSLPRKRVIAQGVLTDQYDRVLLCQLTYKTEWDLPGGVIEPDESPADGLRRELYEELGLEIPVGDLRTVNWLPAWHGWDDACVFVFDLGGADAALTEQMRLQRTEIVDVHWCDPRLVRERATAVTIELLDALSRGAGSYREHGRSGQ